MAAHPKHKILNGPGPGHPTLYSDDLVAATRDHRPGAIAKRYGVTERTVRKWREKHREASLLKRNQEQLAYEQSKRQRWTALGDAMNRDAAEHAASAAKRRERRERRAVDQDDAPRERSRRENKQPTTSSRDETEWALPLSDPLAGWD